MERPKECAALLLRRQPGETYRYLNSAGQWPDGHGLFERYFFNGEIGAEEISAKEAEKLAEQFGSSLEVI